MKKLLIVVDMQKDFIDGSLGSREAAAIVPKVKKKIEEYKAAGDEVIFTLDTHGENYLESLEGSKLPVIHCVRGTDGWELDDRIKEFQGKRFEKSTFGSATIGAYVTGREYESIELVGLCTDICVISNALLMKAFLPETPILVDSSCCAGVTQVSHENALNAMKVCQIEVS
ncbi:isochorismatase family cysteine hydrolase [Clostridium sp. E02]|uniref:cysteine hydrolase family protein n=1 Tax=Clostridium sp. E02 TaxID=2487134 RepID=UPI000F51F731|nr:isochorismatase family cysteine hydrolase [Clostridium sp. E02]